MAKSRASGKKAPKKTSTQRKRSRKSSAKKSCKDHTIRTGPNGGKYCMRRSKVTGKMYRVYM